MGAKSEVLAKQFEAKAQDAASVLEKLSDADWRKMTEAEKWTVGVTAHHLARAFEAVAGIITGIVSGKSPGNFTTGMLDGMNASTRWSTPIPRRRRRSHSSRRVCRRPPRWSAA